jgi:serine/threonine protein kinase
MTWIDDAALERLRQAADSPDLEGTRYQLLGKLGQGGMGGVYRVEDRQLERQVAMKVILVPDADGGLSRRLLREARTIAQLEHPGIVPIHDAGTLPDGRPYYTMKLVEGQSLDEHIASVPAISDRLRLFLRICDAVAFAHARGVLHRDLKPANVMVGPFGEVLVMDWGLSKVLLQASKIENCDAQPSESKQSQLSGQTGHGTVLGTPGYMAPEQGAGGAVDARSDIYSLGAILQFLLVHSTSVATPRALEAIRKQAMAEDPNLRYPTVGELSTDVEHFLDGLPVSAYPEGPVRRARRWILRNRAWLLLLLVYVVVRAVLIFFRPH